MRKMGKVSMGSGKGPTNQRGKYTFGDLEAVFLLGYVMALLRELD